MPDNYMWLKLWHEVRTDAKLRALTGDQHRVWLHLLIFASEQYDERGVIMGFDDELLAVEVAEGDLALLTETIERLIKFRILAREENGYRFLNFNKRQTDQRKPSDQPDETRRRQQESRSRRRSEQTENGDPESASRARHAMSRGVTPMSRGVTPQEVEEEVEEEPEAEQEAEPSVAGGSGGGIPTRARATPAAPASATATATAAAAAPNPDDWSAERLCELVAQRAHLGKRPEVVEQLADVLTGYLARGLSPGDVWRDVQNLVDPSRRGHIAHPSITQISNWLAKREVWHEQQQHERQQQQPGANGAAAANGRRLTAVAGGSGGGGGGGRSAAIIPDPTANGAYAHLITVVSDDDPDPDDD